MEHPYDGGEGHGKDEDVVVGGGRSRGMEETRRRDTVGGAVGGEEHSIFSPDNSSFDERKLEDK